METYTEADGTEVTNTRQHGKIHQTVKKPFEQWVVEEEGKCYYFELDGKGYYACHSAAAELCGGEIKLKPKVPS